MALIKDHQFIEDHWLYYEPDLVPGDHIEGVIFNLQNFTACSHNVPESFKLGLRLANHDSVNAVKPHLADLSLIIVDFPAFADGRAYSQAQELRQHLNFKGEIRAIGNVLIDQYAFMLQCGITSFEVDANIDLAKWQQAAELITSTYNQSLDKDYNHIWSLRNSGST